MISKEYMWLEYEDWKYLKEGYKQIELSLLPEWLIELCSKNKEDEYVGNGLYKIGVGKYGNLITGRKGLKEFDKVMKYKVKRLDYE